MDNEWIEWEGGENPVPGKTVRVELRSGLKSVAPSHAWMWTYTTDSGCDIVRYKVLD